jgi:hypothetical protein
VQDRNNAFRNPVEIRIRGTPQILCLHWWAPPANLRLRINVYTVAHMIDRSHHAAVPGFGACPMMGSAGALPLKSGVRGSRPRTIKRKAHSAFLFSFSTSQLLLFRRPWLPGSPTGAVAGPDFLLYPRFAADVRAGMRKGGTCQENVRITSAARCKAAAE